MLLSDQLLEIGRASNPKNNMSQGNALKEMAKICDKKTAEAKTEAEKLQIYNSLKFSCNTLFKEGFHLFEFEKLNIKKS